ncbi:MAG: arginine--tRNA ligase [Promethearchaeota archaeon]
MDMENPWRLFRQEAIDALKNGLARLNTQVEETELVLEEPPDSKLGDLASPICFSLSKKLKRSPLEIARAVEKEIPISKDSLIDRVEVAGSGYLNFYINWRNFSRLVLEAIGEAGDNYGTIRIGEGKKVIVEHTSANPTKPIHLGTLRCAVLGDIISRVLKHAGYEVEVQNYMDDLGRQVAVMTWGYLNLKDEVPKSRSQKDDFWLGLLYMKAFQALEKNQDVEDEVRTILRRMEEGDNEIAETAERLVDMAVRGQMQTLWSLNIFYDLIIWERDVVQSGLFREALNEMLQSDHVFKLEDGPDAGCIVVDMSPFGDAFASMKKSYKILVRSDGVSTYTGKDIAFQMWKFGLARADLKFNLWNVQSNNQEIWETNMSGETNENFGHAEEVVNVIGYEQKLSQSTVYHALKIMGYEKPFENSHHMAFKFVWLPEQVAFSGRKGTWIGFHTDAVLEKAVELAHKEVEKRNPKADSEFKRRIAKKIGVGALKYYLAKYNPEKKIVIDWKSVLNFEGEAAPYVQYAYVRTQSILKKAKKMPEKANYQLLSEDIEKTIIRRLSKMPEAVDNAAKSYQPHIIVHYVLGLSNAFNEFYHKLPVIYAESKKLVDARLKLVEGVGQVIKNCLKNLLGIDIPEKM